jgi:hypothetical protein
MSQRIKNFGSIMLAVGLIVLAGKIFYNTANSKEQDKQTIKQTQAKNELGIISLDSLSKLNIHITLWTESKQSFEDLEQVQLQSIGSRKEQFTRRTPNPFNDFNWNWHKKNMNWVITTMDLFTHFRDSTDKFVVIGYYTIDAQKEILNFQGDVYKYDPYWRSKIKPKQKTSPNPLF